MLMLLLPPQPHLASFDLVCDEQPDPGLPAAKIPLRPFQQRLHEAQLRPMKATRFGAHGSPAAQMPLEGVASSRLYDHEIYPSVSMTFEDALTCLPFADGLENLEHENGHAPGRIYCRLLRRSRVPTLILAKIVVVSFHENFCHFALQCAGATKEIFVQPHPPVFYSLHHSLRPFYQEYLPPV